jgi:hypothetical protein
MRFTSMLSGVASFGFAVCWAGLAAAQSSPSTDAPDPVAPPPPQDSSSVPTAASPAAMSTTPANPVSTSLPQSEEPRADVVNHTWPNRPLLITGVVVLGGTYAASAIVGAASDREADEKLFYPVIGPWLDLKARDCEVNDCGDDTFNKALLIGDGALQGIGALAIILGLVIPESEKKPWYLIGNENLVVTPQVGTGATGLTAVGQF